MKGLALPGPGLPRSAILAAACWLVTAAVLGAATSVRSSFAPLWNWLTVRHLSFAPNDSWLPMQMAFTRFESGQIASLYDLIDTGVMKFQYPPSSLLLHAAAQSAGLTLDSILLSWISWFAVGLTVLLTVFLWIPLNHRVEPARRPFSPCDQLWLMAATAVFMLLFYPLFKAYALGQVQAWLNLLFALAVWAWLLQRRAAAGVLIGLICLVKPQLSLLMLWALLRGQTRFVAGWVGCFAFGTALSIWNFGLANQLQYLKVLSSLGRRGEAWFPNQSINGLLNRMLSNGNSLEWSAGSFPPFHPVVYAGTMATSIALIVFVMWWRRRQEPDALDFGVAALVFTMASPIAWEHHYGVLAPVALLLLFNLAQISETRTRVLACLGWLAGWIACSLFIPQTNQWANTYLGVFQSTLLFGALGLLFLMVWHRRVLQRVDAGTEQSRRGANASVR